MGGMVGALRWLVRPGAAVRVLAGAAMLAFATAASGAVGAADAADRGVFAGPEAPAPIAIGSLADGKQILGHALYLRDPDGRLTAAEALAAGDWSAANRASRNQGITGAAIWMAFRLANDTDATRSVVVTHDIAFLSAFDVMVYGRAGGPVVTRFDGAGPFAERPLAYAAPAVEVSVPPGETRDVLVRFRNAFPIPMHVGLKLWTMPGFEHQRVAYVALFTFLAACLLMTALFWLLYGVIMRQGRMIAYAVYMVGLAYLCANFFGIAYQLLYPGVPWLQVLGFHWAMFLLIGAAAEFARRHLQLVDRHPVDGTILRVISAVSAAWLAFAVFVRMPAIEAPATFVLLCAVPVYICWLSWRAWRRDGIGYAMWMFLGWLSISVSTVLGILGSGLNEPQISWTQMDFIRLTFVMTVAESLLLSLSLAQWLRGQEALREEAERDATRDALTGLLNRRGFGRRVDELKESGGWPGRLWLAAVDIDSFKAVNDTYTHAAGDAVLVRLSEELDRVCGPDDLAARFGGEEFLVLFSADTRPAAHTTIEAARQRFADVPTVFREAFIAHTFSAGLIRLSDHPGLDDVGLLSRADEALYAAKRGGRNRIHHGTAGDPAVPRDRTILTGDPAPDGGR